MGNQIVQLNAVIHSNNAHRITITIPFDAFESE